MTMPCQRTRAVISAREFLVRLSSPYLPEGFKRIPSEIRQEARRLLRHYPTIVDMAHAADQFDAEEARRHYS